MRYLILLILFSCSSIQKNNSQNEFVTVRTAMDQAQMSYLKGCVDSFRKLGMAPSFDHCKEEAIAHRIELDSIMEQPVAPLD